MAHTLHTVSMGCVVGIHEMWHTHSSLYDSGMCCWQTENVAHVTHCVTVGCVIGRQEMWHTYSTLSDNGLCYWQTGNGKVI